MKKIRLLALVLIISLLSAHYGVIAEIPENVSPESMSIDELTQGAVAGDAQLQTELGYRYATGNGVDQDGEMALYWYQNAVAQGDSRASYLMGSLYMEGDLIPLDAVKAIEHFTSAYEAGYRSDIAARNIAYMYDSDKYGLEMDYAKANEWFEKSAALHNSNAMSHIAFHYIYGRGYEINFDEAARWLESALEAAETENDRGMAYEFMGVLYEIEDTGFTDVQASTAYYAMAAQEGYNYAANALRAADGCYFKTGEYQTAASWYDGYLQTGETENRAHALWILTLIYIDDTHGTKDDVKAASYLAAYLDTGDTEHRNEAMWRYAYIQQFTIGDVQTAAKWYDAYLQTGETDQRAFVLWNLICIYLDDEKGTKDDIKASSYLAAYLETGDTEHRSEAMWRYGYIQYYIIGNTEVGLSWLRQSAEAGNETGKSYYEDIINQQ